MENKLIERRRALTEALDTVRYQIKHLKKFYSREQVRCWYVRRNALKAELDALPTEEQIRQMARKSHQFRQSILTRK